jgi:hypothetical protein
MIERPKRSVTRFFVPLIDVLILLFAIFILMPFVSVPESSESAPPEPKNKAPEDELPRDVRELRADLERYKRELEKLKTERGNLSDRLSVKVLEIDPDSGLLYYFHDGERIAVKDQAAAENLIGQHKIQSGTRDPFFLLLYPRKRSGYPEKPQLEQYERWFKDVQFKFDRPFTSNP